MERAATAPWPRLGTWRIALGRASPVLLICGVVALAYGPAVPNFFVSDDLDMLSGDASDLFSPASGFGRFMPLAAAVHRTVAVAFGLNPLPAHLAQAALHAACAVLVYVLACELLEARLAHAGRAGDKLPRYGRAHAGLAGDEGARYGLVGQGGRAGDEGARYGRAALRLGHRGRALPRFGSIGTLDTRVFGLTAALLFALYPRHHQVVMWFGAISIGLAATLCLATSVLFLRAWRVGSALAGWAAAGTYTAALLAHESAVVLPLLLAALALYERATRAAAGGSGPQDAAGRHQCGSGRLGGARAVSRWRRDRIAGPLRQATVAAPIWLWVFPLASTAHLALLAWAYRARAAVYPDSGYRFLGLGGDLAAAPLRYAAQMLVPPPWTEALALGTPGLVIGAAALAVAARWAWRGGFTMRLGLAWTASAAAPFVLFGIYGVTDRYYYLPSVGLALAGAATLARVGRWRTWAVAAYAAVAIVLLLQVAGDWRLAGARVWGTMDYLAAWAADTRAPPPEAAAFVGVPFKRGERWPGSQVYVFSTGLVGAAHLATDWPALRVSYVFADEHPGLGAGLAALAPAPGPPGLYLFTLDGPLPEDRTAVLGAALPDLARLRWRGASRTPIEWTRYGVTGRRPEGGGP